MRRYAANKITDLFASSGASFVAALFFFVLGISAGVFTELMMENSQKETIIMYLDKYFLLNDLKSVTFSDTFFSSTANNIGLLVIIFFSGLTVIGFPVALAALIYKGMALGFSSALLIDSMSYKGIVLVFTSMIPQNLLLVPAVFIAVVAALNMAFTLFSSRRFGIKKSLAESSGPYLLLNGILLAVILVGCFIESFISPILTQLIV